MVSEAFSRRYALWLQFGILLSYALVARFVFNFERPFPVFLGCVALGVVLDFIVGRLHFKRMHSTLTAVVITCGGGLQVYSPSPWCYLALIALAILSKAFLLVNGRHIFNPTNFGIVTLLILFPNWVVPAQSLFSNYLVPAAVFLLAGTVLAIVARRAAVAFSWMGGFIVLSMVRGLVQPVSTTLLFLQILNPTLLLFTFHMITDPMTTPSSTRGGIAFGLTVAVVDATLRLLHIPASPFYALFVVNSLRPLVEVVGVAPEARTAGPSGRTASP